MLNSPNEVENSASDSLRLSPASNPGSSRLSASPAASSHGRRSAHRINHRTDSGRRDALDLGAMLSVLWRWRRLMLTTFSVVLLLGLLLTVRQRSIYEATCSILISAPADTAAVAGDSLRSLLTATQPRSVGTQLAIMRSYPVQRSTLRRLSPPEREIAQAYYKLDVRPQRDSEAIDIVAESYDAKVAARLANALSDEYMTQYQQQNRAQVREATREVAQQLALARQRLDEASTNLKNFKQSNKTIDLAEESKVRIAQLNQIESTLRDLRSERAANVAQIKALSKNVSAMKPIEVLPDRIVRRPAVEALRGQLTQLELQRIATLRRYRPGSPEVRALEAQQVAVEGRLKTDAQTEVGSWIRSVNPIRQGLVQEITQTQSQVWASDARARALEQAAQAERALQALLPDREYRLTQLSTEQSVLQQTYQLINEKYQSLVVSEGSKLAIARPLAPAEPPQTPIRPRRALNLILSAMIGVALAVTLAALCDRMDDRVRSVETAEDAAQLPVLAEVPFIASPTNRNLPANLDSPGPLLESFRILRGQLIQTAPRQHPASFLSSGTNFGHETADESTQLDVVSAYIAKPVYLSRSILVSSSRQGEGKSFCALNLAIATALSGKKVVLVDCDLRHPAVHGLLGMENLRGLADIAQGTVSLSAALQKTAVPGLLVLTSGSPTSQPTELLESGTVRQALQDLRAGVDLVVLDCPDVLSVADTQIIAMLADTAVLVVGSGVAEHSEVTQAYELLSRTGINLPGLVFNQLDAKSAV